LSKQALRTEENVPRGQSVKENSAVFAGSPLRSFPIAADVELHYVWLCPPFKGGFRADGGWAQRRRDTAFWCVAGPFRVWKKSIRKGVG